VSRELMTPAEVREQLAVSRWTLWRLVRDGKLTPYLVGGRKRFHISEIRKLKAAKAVQAGA
jgi:excisionase family DNA binding protein